MALIIVVKVVPSSGRNKWVIDKSGSLKAYLKSPPERGLANNELIVSIAKATKLTQNQIILISGQRHRTKRIKIDADISYDQIIKALGIEQQLDLFKKGD